MFFICHRQLAYVFLAVVALQVVLNLILALELSVGVSLNALAHLLEVGEANVHTVIDREPRERHKYYRQ
jgi:hypothetical protein